MTSDAGALLLGAADRVIGLTRRFAGCFQDARHPGVAKLRRTDIDASAGTVEEVARIVAQIRRRWPKTRILLRADFARDALMAWCKANRVDYLFGWL